jgi:hypothetical protein
MAKYLPRPSRDVKPFSRGFGLIMEVHQQGSQLGGSHLCLEAGDMRALERQTGRGLDEGQWRDELPKLGIEGATQPS